MAESPVRRQAGQGMAAPGEKFRGSAMRPPLHPADQVTAREVSPIRMNPISAPALTISFR